MRGGLEEWWEGAGWLGTYRQGPRVQSLAHIKDFFPRLVIVLILRLPATSMTDDRSAGGHSMDRSAAREDSSTPRMQVVKNGIFIADT